MHVLVTGAAGFIGSHLVDRLLERGDRVTGLDNFDPFYSPTEKRTNLTAALSNPGFRLIECDVADRHTTRARLRDQSPDVIVHLAARPGVRQSVANPLPYDRVNVGGTSAMLHAAADNGVKAFVLASSSSVYGIAAHLPFREDDPKAAPVSPYAATKRAAESLCQAHQRSQGGAVLCLRLFTAYGPRQRPDLMMRHFSSLITSGRPAPVFGDGSSERDYTWIDDVVDGLISAVDRSAAGRSEFEIVNLGSGRPTALSRVIELLATALGARPTIQHLPEHPGDVRRTWADLAKAQALLGYRPRVALEDGIEQFVTWYLARRTGSSLPFFPRRERARHSEGA